MVLHFLVPMKASGENSVVSGVFCCCIGSAITLDFDAPPSFLLPTKFLQYSPFKEFKSKRHIPKLTYTDTGLLKLLQC